MFKETMIVERNIDGAWFQARIIKIDRLDGSLTLQYTDDDNIEEFVSTIDVRAVQESKSMEGSPKVLRKNSLPKPLVGLVEDDEEERRAHRPTATVHCNEGVSDSEEKAVIINGSSTKLAAGGGLRALRYLK